MIFFAFGAKCSFSRTGPAFAAKSFSLKSEASAMAPMPEPHCWRKRRRVLDLILSSGRESMLSAFGQSLVEIEKNVRNHCPGRECSGIEVLREFRTADVN